MAGGKDCGLVVLGLPFYIGSIRGRSLRDKTHSEVVPSDVYSIVHHEQCGFLSVMLVWELSSPLTLLVWENIPQVPKSFMYSIVF